jgi:hypothetical protein
MPVIFDPLWPEIIFEPSFPVQDGAELICGPTMIIIASCVYSKIKNKANKFAFAILSLIVLLGLANIGLAVTDSFATKVALPDNLYHHFDNIYALASMRLFYYLSSAALVMIFTGKYLSNLYFTATTIKLVGFSVGIVSAVTMTAFTIWPLFTFPGYFDSNGSMTLYNNWIGRTLLTVNTAIWASLLTISAATTTYAIHK